MTVVLILGGLLCLAGGVVIAVAFCALHKADKQLERPVTRSTQVNLHHLPVRPKPDAPLVRDSAPPVVTNRHEKQRDDQP